MPHSVSVLISDANESFRQLLRQALAAAQGLRIAAVSGSIKETIKLAQALQPDMILLSVALLNGDGPQAAEAGLFQASKVLLISELNCEVHTLQLLQLGAWGCLVKDEELLEKLPEAIRAVDRGEAVLSPRLAGWMLDTLRP